MAAVVTGVVVYLMLGIGSTRAAPPGCPANTSSDLYVNTSTKINRGKKLVPTGVSSPIKCTFASLGAALAAVDNRGLSSARIILTGGSPSAPAVAAGEVFPLAIPSGVTVTTSDDPALGGGGLNPASYIVRFGGTASRAFSLHGGALKGITVKNERSSAGAAMAVCDGTAAFDTVTLDGASGAGGAIATGLQLSSGCVADGDGVRVRNFGGNGVVVDDGADLTLGTSKVYGNGGDGLAISGSASTSNGEFAFNGDDGALVSSSASVTFAGNDVRDNGGNGFEVHSSASSFSSNFIHNNSRSTGWDEPQVLFSGENAAADYFGTPGECLFGAPCFNFDFRGSANSTCADFAWNRIYSYDISDTGNFDTVGLRAVNNAHVYAQNNVWRSTDVSQNVTAASDGSSVAAGVTCGAFPPADPSPGPPVN